MIRTATNTGRRLLRLACRAATLASHRIADFGMRAWRHHTELMHESTPYRQQLALVITTSLGLMRLHPSFALLGATLGALYVASFQRQTDTVHVAYEEDRDRSRREDLRPRFHDLW